MKTVKILNTKTMKIHYADKLGPGGVHDSQTVYRLQCSLQGVYIPEFLGHWNITKGLEVDCGRCLKSKKVKKNER